jgi:hypothetical protein
VEEQRLIPSHMLARTRVSDPANDPHLPEMIPMECHGGNPALRPIWSSTLRFLFQDLQCFEGRLVPLLSHFPPPAYYLRHQRHHQAGGTPWRAMPDALGDDAWSQVGTVRAVRRHCSHDSGHFVKLHCKFRGCLHWVGGHSPGPRFQLAP